MKKIAYLAALATLIAAPAFAGSSDYLTIDEIVETTGMEKREVLLMLGPVSNNHLYLTSYNRVSREWKQVIEETGLVIEQVRDANGRIALAVRRPDANDHS